MNVEKNSSESGTEEIIIDRVRHFRRFIIPSLMKCIDEITFYNTGKELNGVKYALEYFRPSLHIFDSNGEQLEFYGAKDSRESGREIYIDFPKHRPPGGRQAPLPNK